MDLKPVPGLGKNQGELRVSLEDFKTATCATFWKLRGLKNYSGPASGDARVYKKWLCLNQEFSWFCGPSYLLYIICPHPLKETPTTPSRLGELFDAAVPLLHAIATAGTV